MANFYGTTAYDYFVGPNERNDYYFDGRELGWTATDVIIGGAAEDVMHFTGAQTFGVGGSTGLEWIASIEYFYFDDFDDDIEIPNGIAATSSIGSTYRVVVRAGGGEDFINARGVTSSVAILLEGEDGDDDIWGGGGDGSKYTGGDGEDFIDLTASLETAEGGGDDDLFYGDVAEINGDTIDGGLNYDTLTMAAPGTFGLTMTSVEYLYLDGSADNNVTIESPQYDQGGGNSTFGNIYGGRNADTVTVESVAGSGTWQSFVIMGEDGNDVLTGGNGDDRLEGGNGVDGLGGGEGDDTLIGGAEGDLMAGGVGDDTYVGVESGDLVLESIGLNGGIDTIETDQFNYVMPGFVEVLRYTGSSDLRATGNSVDNTIEGTPYLDTLSGLGGNDSLSGLGADDTLLGGAGLDTLDGGTGDDDMEGGADNDSYIVDSAGDRVVELANEGIDLVYSSVTFSLADNVDYLLLTGDTNIGGTGNQLGNYILGGGGGNLLKGLGGGDTLYGLDGTDTLKGGAGDDSLYGGTNNDVLEGGGNADILQGEGGVDDLYGGTGSDTFRFASLAENSSDALRDTIRDFVAGTDKIDLTGLGFSSLVNGAFTGVAGELRVSTGANTFLFGDTNGDRVADFSLILSGVVPLALGDFIL
jgi:Ca2+-binding RTX toxin-like protein